MAKSDLFKRDEMLQDGFWFVCGLAFLLFFGWFVGSLAYINDYIPESETDDKFDFTDYNLTPAQMLQGFINWSQWMALLIGLIVGFVAAMYLAGFCIHAFRYAKLSLPFRVYISRNEDKG